MPKFTVAQQDQHNDQLLADARDRISGARYRRLMGLLERMGRLNRDDVQDVVLVAYLGLAFVITAQNRMEE